MDGDSENDRDSRLFPDKETDVDDDIKCAALTHDFLIFGTSLSLLLPVGVEIYE